MNEAVRNVKSQLIDLKAELFRKQEEFKNQKLQSHNAAYIKGKPSGAPNKKPNIFSKKNAGVAQRAEKDYEEKKEEEDVFDRSRKALENKARLYEKITSGKEIPEEDGSDIFLVDFQKKVIDDVEERTEKERQEKEDRERREAEEDRQRLQEPVPAADNDDEEWVDYVDSFGRSRRCLKKDLGNLQRADRKMGMEPREKSVDTPNLLSEDMRRDIERQKWEKEETEKMEKEKEGPIHYSDVRYNEIRSHGVGYYQFDKEEETRREQMEQLQKLREQTKDERSKKERIKEKRKAALAARLAKVKQRKREKMGITEEDEEKADLDEEVGPKLSEMTEAAKEPEPLTRDDSWRQTADLTREWDKGKERSMERSEQAWLEKQRSERESEFAPPSFYYEDRKPSTQPFSGGKHTTKNERENQFAPPSFYHEDRRSNKQTFNDKQNKASNKQSKTYSQAADNKSDVVDDRENTEQYIDKSSEILASVIMNKLKGYRSDLEFENAAANIQHSTTGANADEQTNNYDSSSLSGVAPTSSNTEAYSDTMQSYQYQYATHPTFQDTSLPPPNFPVPFPNMNIPPPPNFQVPPPTNYAPPPNVTVPPPDLSVPPPGMNIHQPNYPLSNINPPPPPPPQTFSVKTEHVPGTDYSQYGQSSTPYIGQINQVAPNQTAAVKTEHVPVPGTDYSQYGQSSTPYIGQTNQVAPNQTAAVKTEHVPVPGTDYSQYGQSSTPYIGQTNQVAPNQTAAVSGTIAKQPKKVIPKMDIMDTRLVQKEDD